MAFTRSFLKEQGLEKEQIDNIMEAHTEVTDALKAQRDEYKVNAEKLPSVQKELDDRKNGTAAEGDKYKAKYETLQKEYEQYKTDVATKETTAKKEAEARRILRENNIPDKYIEKILKYSAEEVAAIEIDDDGKATKTEAFIKTIDSDWSDYKTTQKKEGANTATPPDGSTSGSGKTYSSKKEIMGIKDPVERQQAIADNHELFGL